MVYFNKINGDETVYTSQNSVLQQTPQQNQKKVQVVPVVQKSKNKKNEDIDKLPQGYYVEKSKTDEPPAQSNDEVPSEEQTEQPINSEEEVSKPEQFENEATENDDEEPDTDIHPDARITIDSIALTQANQIDDAIEGAEIKGLNSAIEESGNKIDNAITMIKSDPLSILDQKFQKGIHGAGIGRFEITNYKGEVTDVTKFNRTTNTKRIDFSGTYESLKGNAKIMLYASGTTSERYVKADFNIASTSNDDVPDESTQDTLDISNPEESDSAPSSETTDSREKLNKYSLYAGGKFKIKKDELSTVVLHAKGGELENSKTTQIDTRYHINQYNVNVDTSTIIYNIGSKNSIKTGVSCYFNAKDKPIEKQDESSDNTVSDNDVNEDNSEHSPVQNQNKKDKKMGKKRRFNYQLKQC